jgi:hypothetical protein
MPIIDFRCTACGYAEQHFYALSTWPYPDRVRCEKCKKRSERDWMLGSASVGFTDKSGKSIVLHLNTKTGEYSVPGDRDDPLPGRDYKRVAITSMKQYEKVRREMEATAREEAQAKQAVEREYFDTTYKEHREQTRQKVEQAIEKGGHWVQESDEKGITRTRWAPISPRARQFFELACNRADVQRRQLRSQRESGNPNVHSRGLEYRESERSIVSGTAKRPQMPNLEELMRKIRR